MASTSEDPKGFDPMEQVTPFFNRAQLFAFSQAPSADALGRVNRGGSHDYLPQEYVRALLDRFIGPGRWAIRVSLVKTYEEKIQKNGKENNAVTAIVNVELDILSAIDPDKRLTYAGIGTHTMEAAADKGVAAVVGNAITSAESKGLKAAAKNLGKAFGSDLKNKLDRNTLPPSIAQYATQLSEQHARRSASRSAPQLPAPEQGQEQSEAAPALEPVAETRRQDPPAKPREERQPEQEPPARQERTEEPERQTRRQPAEDERRDAEPAREPEQRREAPKQREQEAASDKPVDKPADKEPAKGSGAQAGDQAAKGGANWELGIMPSDYQEWLACIRTIQARIAAMTSETEIANFVRRNKKTIAALPHLPAEGERGPKDFATRFKIIVGRKYEDLGLAIPAEYVVEQEPAVAEPA
jgi:hypothetical protein